MAFAKVAIPVPLGQAFSYQVPSELRTRVVRGARVLCSFGRREVLGVVLEVSEQPPEIAADKLKSISAVVDGQPVIPEALLDFLLELARYYLAPIGEVMRLALPRVERGDLEQLAQQGLLGRTKVQGVGRMLQFVERVSAAGEAEETRAKALKGSAAKLYLALANGEARSLSELENEFPNVRAAVKRLKELELVRVLRKAAPQDPFFATPATADIAPQLTGAQAIAAEAIVAALEARKSAAFLLHGVTGSGKTEVYLRATARCLKLGRSAIILVPEIALTPQLVARFRSRLGDNIAVLHSGLTQLERQTMWQMLRSGALRVAIGARSALFAPVQDLALLCVDEEHDASFKQEEGVHYNARDMALLRAHRSQAVCVLGSATPSLASEARVQAGKLERLLLPERAHHTSVLPSVEVVDMKRFGPARPGERLITVPLFRALEEVLEKKEQAILFLNRRGFAPSVVCEACGAISECPNCALALTLHKHRGDRLVCHYCDYTSKVPSVCVKCKSDRLTHEGVGTEGIEASLKQFFPEARVARLDRDVASGIKSEKVLDRMRNGELDILVGTQMVTKGHDLPNVTLVGVLNADAALSLPDFQAAERTFQLLVQVAGRAGRGDKPGRVIIQTRNPEHPAIRFARAHDVRQFVEHELAERRDLRYPPFARLALVRIDSLDRATAEECASALAAIARKASSKVEVLGPTPAPLPRLRNRYRFRFVVRGMDRPELRKALIAVLKTRPDHRVRIAVDIDPMHML